MNFKEWFYRNEVVGETPPLQPAREAPATREFDIKNQAVQTIQDAVKGLQEFAAKRHVSLQQRQTEWDMTQREITDKINKAYESLKSIFEKVKDRDPSAGQILNQMNPVITNFNARMQQNDLNYSITLLSGLLQILGYSPLMPQRVMPQQARTA